MPKSTTTRCYLTDAVIPNEKARRLILSDGEEPPHTTEVVAHETVLAFLADQGDVKQLGNSFIAFV